MRVIIVLQDGSRVTFNQVARVISGAVIKSAPEARNYARGKINYEIAQEVRREYHSTDKTRQQLAAQYGVSVGAIENIVYNRTWVKSKPE